MKSNKHPIWGIFILFTVLILGYQNCSQTTSSVAPSQLSSGGNGEPWTGIGPAPGTYYAVKAGFNCPTSSSGSFGINTTARIKVTSFEITWEENCTQNSQRIFLNELHFESFNKLFMGFSDQVYENIDPNELNKPEYSNPAAFMYCQVQNVPAPQLGIDMVIQYRSLFDPIGVSYTFKYITFDGESVIVSTNIPINGRDGSAVEFYGPGFVISSDLNKQNPDDLTYNGSYNGPYQGEDVELDLKCVRPENKPD